MSLGQALDRRFADAEACVFPSTFGKRGVFFLAAVDAFLVATALLALDLFEVPGLLEVLLVGTLLLHAALGVAGWIHHRYGRYVVAGGTLTIRRQWHTRRIPLASITGVRRPARTGIRIDGPDDFALGNNLVEIRYGERSRAFVSPRDEGRFVAAIGQRGLEPATGAAAWLGPVPPLGVTSVAMALFGLAVFFGPA